MQTCTCTPSAYLNNANCCESLISSKTNVPFVCRTVIGAQTRLRQKFLARDDDTVFDCIKNHHAATVIVVSKCRKFQKTELYLTNDLTDTRHVWTCLNGFLTLIPNMAMIFHNFEIFYNILGRDFCVYQLHGK